MIGNDDTGIARRFQRTDGRRHVGGAFIQEQTRTLILEQALAIWLEAEPGVLAERVRRRDTRPLLRGRDPAEVLTELAAIRNPFYAMAPIRVVSVAAPHDATVNAILKELEGVK